jgi:predicted aspartyl protease
MNQQEPRSRPLFTGHVRWLLMCVSLSLTVLAPSSPQAAAQCGPQKLASVVDLTMDYGVPIVAASLMGKRKQFIVDTGGVVSVLFPATVGELGLPRRNVAMKIIGVDGDFSNQMVRVPEFALGRLRATDIPFMVSAGRDTGPIPDGAPAGIVGPEILQNYDADFDFAGGKLNLIDPNHCAGDVVYWPASTVAVIPFRLDSDFHITFQAMVDGKRIDAMLDTGMSITTMRLDAAERLFDLDRNAPDLEKVGELQGKQYTANIYQRRFGTLAVQGLAVNNSVMRLMPDMVRSQLPSGPATGSLLPEAGRSSGLPGLIIGMSDLSKMHVYIAYKERKIYITSDSPDVVISAR